MPTARDDSGVHAVKLDTSAGIRVTLVDRGAAIQSIRVPTDRDPVEVCLGYDRLADYIDDPHFLGMTLGRYANRIRNARFKLDGTHYDLDANDGEFGNCLHGGRDGLHRRAWQFDADSEGVEFRYRSLHGEGGFPGELEITVIYQIVNDCSLQIDFRARSDRDTVISLANHAYFNLDQRAPTIDQHQLAVFADHYTPVDGRKVPTGEIRSVADTRFDLRRALPLTDASGDALRFDHNFVLPESAGRLRKVAEINAPSTALRMILHTTQPSLQVYTGDYLGSPFAARQGLCLEAQRFPDAPNQPGFPSARLAAGDCYEVRTVYEFVTESY